MVSHRPFCEAGPEGQVKLLVAVGLRLGDGSVVRASALVDTGAEINLLRRGLVGPQYFCASERPKRFITASRAVMEGGSVEVACTMEMQGVDVDTGRRECLSCPTTFYDADMGVDAILSYEWLVKNGMDVRCRRHGLEAKGTKGPIWIPGEVLSPVVHSLEVGKVHNVTYGRRPYQKSGGQPKVVDYTVRWPFFQEVTRRFGVQPQRDCFASEGNRRCAKFWTVGDDALQQSWGKGEVLWMNPPWDLWPKVAEKIVGQHV